MAEALLKKRAPERFDAYSAGLAPKEIDPLTVKVMSEVGIDWRGHQAKHVRQYLGRLAVRYAIFVCERTEEDCPITWPGALGHMQWPFEDPAACQGPDEERLQKFRAVRDEIDQKLANWLTQLPVG